MELGLDYHRIRLEYDLPSVYRNYMEARFKTSHLHKHLYTISWQKKTWTVEQILKRLAYCRDMKR